MIGEILLRVYVDLQAKRFHSSGCGSPRTPHGSHRLSPLVMSHSYGCEVSPLNFDQRK
jgi:hypothetical protein